MINNELVVNRCYLLLCNELRELRAASLKTSLRWNVVLTPDKNFFPSGCSSSWLLFLAFCVFFLFCLGGFCLASSLSSSGAFSSVVSFGDSCQYRTGGCKSVEMLNIETRIHQNTHSNMFNKSCTLLYPADAAT